MDMAGRLNRQFILASCPTGGETPGDFQQGNLRMKEAKLVTIGQIGMYGKAASEPRRDFLPRFVNIVHYKNVELKGFQVDQMLRTYPEFLAAMTPLVSDGTIKYREDFIDGFEKLPEALASLYKGGNNGKLIVRVG
jgi:NADPH-dependent curcumin reductase